MWLGAGAVTLLGDETAEAAGVVATFRSSARRWRDLPYCVSRFLGAFVSLRYRRAGDASVHGKARPDDLLRGHGHARFFARLHLDLLAGQEGRRSLFSPPWRTGGAKSQTLGRQSCFP